MRLAPLLALAALLAIPGVAAGVEDAYRVVAAHPEWGPLVGTLEGSAETGSITLRLEGVWTLRYWTTIGGTRQYHETAAGEVVVDNWSGPGGDKFVATHVRGEEGALPAASGGGRIDGFALTVVGHT